MGNRDERAKNAEAGVARFFRVELDTEHVSLFDDRRERGAVVGCGRARRVAHEVEAIALKLAAAGEIAFTIEARETELIVTAACGTRKEQTIFPL